MTPVASLRGEFPFDEISAALTSPDPEAGCDSSAGFDDAFELTEVEVRSKGTLSDVLRMKGHCGLAVRCRAMTWKQQKNKLL